MGSYTGRDLNSLNCYINRKFKGLCGAVKAEKQPCASGSPRGLLQQPTLSQVFFFFGRGLPAFQTKVNCSGPCSHGPRSLQLLSASACLAHTGRLRALVSCRPLEELSRTVSGCKGARARENTMCIWQSGDGGSAMARVRGTGGDIPV